jgi:hypothetical protein
MSVYLCGCTNLLNFIQCNDLIYVYCTVNTQRLSGFLMYREKQIFAFNYTAICQKKLLIESFVALFVLKLDKD